MKLQRLFRLFISTYLLNASLFAMAWAQESSSPKEFINPGGMWMPQQIKDHAETLKQLGLEIDPLDLSDPTSSTMSAIVSLEFCSGSFISSSGLIITNHHCVQGMLSFLSQEDQKKGLDSDYVRDGFLAKSREQERPVQASQKIYVTQTFTDISDTLLAGVSSVVSPEARDRLVEARTKAVLKASEEKPNIRAEVKSFFRGEKYYLIEKLELKDVRLVYAPPGQVGFYGGNTDNWHWPRHTGDFGLIRAYVGPNQKPADYAPENVPYQPKSHLTVAKQGLQPNDLVLVAGYPGSTDRLNTADEVVDQLNRSMPHRIQVLRDWRNLLVDLGRTDESIRIKTQSLVFSLDNTIENQSTGLRLLKEIGYAQQKQQFENELQAWIAQDESRQQKYGSALAEMKAIREKSIQGWQAKSSLRQIVRWSDLIGTAVHIVRLAEEKTKPDLERESDYMKRNWDRLKEETRDLEQSFSMKVEKETTKMILQGALQLPQDERPAYLAQILDLKAIEKGTKSIDSEVDALFDGTQLTELNQRLQLLENATTESLQTSKDSLIQMALKLVPHIKEMESKNHGIDGEKLLAAPRYVQAVREYKASLGEMLAPDANSTLRVTYGLIKGYVKPGDGKFYAPFTHIGQLLDKHVPGDEEFEVPQKVIDAAKERNFGNYADSYYGELPINFLANVDTTGGNSGSAALNSKGELIGLLFDGNDDALFSDWVFDDKLVRSILLDIRYFLWMLDEVDDADHILQEIGVKEQTQAIPF